jgi:hypothetical protein
MEHGLRLPKGRGIDIQVLLVPGCHPAYYTIILVCKINDKCQIENCSARKYIALSYR